MQVKKQHLELDLEQQTGSKLGKEYVKTVYCHSAYLTSLQSTSCPIRAQACTGWGRWSARGAPSYQGRAFWTRHPRFEALIPPAVSVLWTCSSLDLLPWLLVLLHLCPHQPLPCSSWLSTHPFPFSAVPGGARHRPPGQGCVEMSAWWLRMVPGALGLLSPSALT